MILRWTVQVHFVTWGDVAFYFSSKRQWRKLVCALRQRGKRMYQVLATSVPVDYLCFIVIYDALEVVNEKSGRKFYV